MADPNENISSENLDEIDGGAIDRGRFTLINVANQKFSPESSIHAFAITYYHNLLDNCLFGKNHNIQDLRNRMLNLETNTSQLNSFINQIEAMVTNVVLQISTRKR